MVQTLLVVEIAQTEVTPRPGTLRSPPIKGVRHDFIASEVTWDEEIAECFGESVDIDTFGDRRKGRARMTGVHGGLSMRPRVMFENEGELAAAAAIPVWLPNPWPAACGVPMFGTAQWGREARMGWVAQTAAR